MYLGETKLILSFGKWFFYLTNNKNRGITKQQKVTPASYQSFELTNENKISIPVCQSIIPPGFKFPL